VARAVIYQVYLRSFVDGDGDGVGDIDGLRGRCLICVTWRVDAICDQSLVSVADGRRWLRLADYRDIDPLVSDRADAERCCRGA